VKEEGAAKRREWAEWIDKKKNCLSNPSSLMMMQGMIVAQDGDLLRTKNDEIREVGPCVLVLSRSATTDMEKKLTDRVDMSKPISTDNSILGDITTPGKGTSLLISKFRNAEGKDRYEVMRGSRILDFAPDYVASAWIPWDKLLRKETAAWQIRKLMETFDPESVDYVFSEDSDYAPLVPNTAKGSYARSQQKSMVVSPGMPYQPAVQAIPPQSFFTTAPSLPAYSPTAMAPAMAPAPAPAPAPAQAPVQPQQEQKHTNPIMDSIMREKARIAQNELQF